MEGSAGGVCGRRVQPSEDFSGNSFPLRGAGLVPAGRVGHRLHWGEREREWTCWIKKKRDENKYHNLTCIKYPSYTCKKKEKKNLKHNHRSEKHPLQHHASLTFMWLFWKWKVAVQHVHIWKSRCKRVINTVSVNELRDEVFRVQLEGLGCGSISTQWGRRMQQAERLPEAAVTALTVALMNESELSVTFTSGRETPA